MGNSQARQLSIMITLSPLYFLPILMSCVLADSNTTNTTMVSCEDMLTTYQALGRVRMAFGCDLGNTSLGISSSCDESILSTMKSCNPVTMSCLSWGINTNCQSHVNKCDATARVYQGLKQSLKVWCGPQSEPDDDCPWYKQIECGVAVGAAVAACSECVEAPELCEECIDKILEGTDCLDCACTICGCC